MRGLPILPVTRSVSYQQPGKVLNSVNKKAGMGGIFSWGYLTKVPVSSGTWNTDDTGLRWIFIMSAQRDAAPKWRAHHQAANSSGGLSSKISIKCPRQADQRMLKEVRPAQATQRPRLTSSGSFMTAEPVGGDRQRVIYDSQERLRCALLQSGVAPLQPLALQPLAAATGPAGWSPSPPAC